LIKKNRQIGSDCNDCSVEPVEMIVSDGLKDHGPPPGSELTWVLWTCCPQTPFFNDGGYTVCAHCNGS